MQAEAPPAWLGSCLAASNHALPPSFSDLYLPSLCTPVFPMTLAAPLPPSLRLPAVSVILAYFVSSDGSSNWLLGLQLVATYCLIGRPG